MVSKNLTQQIISQIVQQALIVMKDPQRQLLVQLVIIALQNQPYHSHVQKEHMARSLEHPMTLNV
jgi:hypothetical protein